MIDAINRSNQLPIFWRLILLIVNINQSIKLKIFIINQINNF